MVSGTRQRLIQADNTNDDLKTIISGIITEKIAPLTEEIIRLKKEVSYLKESNDKLVKVLSKQKLLSQGNDDNNDEINVSEDSEASLDITVIDTEASEPWQITTRKKRQRRQQKPKANNTKTRRSVIRGTAVAPLADNNLNEDNRLKAANRRLWIYVGRCDKTTTEENVKYYLQCKLPEHEFIVNKLTSKGSNASFKVGADISLQETLYDSNFWPQDIAVKRYLFFRSTSHSGQPKDE